MRKHRTLLYLIVGAIILKFLISQVVAYMGDSMLANNTLFEELGTQDEEKIIIQEVLNNHYDDLTNDISINIDTMTLDDLNVLSGTTKCSFELRGDIEFDDIEITLKVSSEIANDLDVIAIYKYDNDTWKILGYYEVVQDKFIMELKELGTFALVNKTEGEKNTSPIVTNESKTPEVNFRNRANEVGCFSSEQDIVISHWSTYDYSNNVEFFNTNFKTSETGRITFRDKNSEEYANIYFENCTFDGVTFGFENKGHYVFNNCLFVNSPISSLEILGENVDINIYVYNSILRDNKPDKEEFNANNSSVRHWKYTAIGYRRSNATVHVVKTLIENYMTNTTIYENEDTTANKLYFEYSAIKNVEGCAICMNSQMKGRIDNNEFYNIGELRGKNGYAIKYDEEYGGSGVGGNAIFTRERNREMRVYKNYIKNVMENAIEGHYYCVNDNIIDGTGYRFYEPCVVNINGEDVELPGYQTVSTEAIWGGSWQVKNNIIKNVHGRGIMINRWDDVPTEVSGNIIIKGNINVTEEYSGIKITSTGGTKNVLVTNNKVFGFVNKYRVQNTTDGILENIVINDRGKGKLMGIVYSSLRSVQFTSDRQQPLNLTNSNMEQVDSNDKIVGWKTKNLLGEEPGEEEGIKFYSIKSKDDRGRIYQELDLPKETCIVCLKVNLRSTTDKVRVFVKSKDDDGNVYESSNGGSYDEYKIEINGVDSEEFRTYYVCFKALDHTTIGIIANETNQIVDVESIEGYYMIDDIPQDADGPLDGEFILDKDDINEGEEISIQFKINSEEKINNIQGQLEFDEDLWEPISTNSFEGSSNWNEVEYNANTKSFNIINNSDSNSENDQDQDVFEIKFRSSISADKKNSLRNISNNKLDASIKFKDVEAYGDEMKLALEDEEKVISVSYIIEQGNDDLANNTVNNTIANNTVNNTVDNTIINNTVDNNVANNTVNNTIDNNTVNNTVVNNTVNNTIVNNAVNNTIDNNIVNNTVNNTVVNNTVTNKTVKNTVQNTTKKTYTTVTNVTYIIDSSSSSSSDSIIISGTDTSSNSSNNKSTVTSISKVPSTGDIIPVVAGGILGIILIANIIQIVIKKTKKEKTDDNNK